MLGSLHSAGHILDFIPLDGFAVDAVCARAFHVRFANPSEEVLTLRFGVRCHWNSSNI